MATTIITAPLGTASTQAFTYLIHPMGWDPVFGVNVIVSPDRKVVQSGTGPGQGVCVYPELAQSSGFFYYEITWTELESGSGLSGGIGLGGIGSDYFSMIGGVGNGGGIILRPDGTIWTDGQQWNGVLPPQQPGDTVGVLLEFVPDVFISVTWLGAGGNVQGSYQATLISDADLNPILPFPIIPFAIFGNDSMADTQTANFSLDRDAYLGPKAFPDFARWDEVSYGWPNTA